MIFVLAIAALTLVGLVLLAIPYVRALDGAAQLSIAFGGGMLIASLVMFAMSVAHVTWSRTLLVVLFVIIAGLAVKRWPDIRRVRVPLLVLIPIAITLYGVLDARETCGDFLLFWGPKAVHFAFNGRIDTDFLAFPFYYLMHPDYPPLLTLVYAWGAMAAHAFSWWGALALTPLLLLTSVLAFRGMAAHAIGERNASLYALLFASVLAFAYEIGPVGGAGEPPLIFFETIAIAALTFAPSDRGAMLVASLMSAAAVLTKVEGTMFAVILLIAYVMSQRRIKPALLMAIPSALALGAWLLFVRHHGLLDIYGARPPHYENVGKVITHLFGDLASYSVYYLPWIALVVPMIFARNFRRAAMPLLVTAGSLAAAVYVYCHMPDPTFFIDSSAHRLLLTPLMTLSVATAAASE